jgi:hypothetical protein
MAEGSRFAKSLKSPIQWIVVGLILIFLGVVLVLPMMRGRLLSPHSDPVNQTVRTIGVAMYAYAMDHNGAYPTGKSSTEVFQKLVDEGYVTEPAMFCCDELKMPGKSKATSGKLKPENVCWDVTIPLDAAPSDDVPVVFSSGYRINYVPGGDATPILSAPKPRYDGVSVCYHSNSASWQEGQPDGIVPNFISPDFKPDGKKYVQLTPDGPLGP